MWAGCSSYAAPLKGVNTWCAVGSGREWQIGRDDGIDWKKWKNMVNCPGKMPNFTSQMAK